MALKTFNLNPEVYKEFADHCKKEGISMSKKIEKFIRSEVDKIKPPKMPNTQEKNDDELITENSFSKYCH